MSTIMKIGRHDLPPEVYHSDPAPAPSLSSTLARKLLSASPLHAWSASPRLNPGYEPETKTAFDIGTACHDLQLTGGQRIACLPYDDFRTKDARQAAAEARQHGQTPLNAQQADQVHTMHAAAQWQLDAHGIGRIFDRTINEQSFFAEVDGIWCRCMVDALDDEAGVIYDYKTTAASASPDAFQRTACSYGYDVQAAHYLAVVKAVTGRDWRFRFVVQEKAEPWALSVVELTPDWLLIADKMASRAREMWGQCLKTYGSKPWPGYPAEIAMIDAPLWREKTWLDREEAEADYKAATGRDVLDAAMKFQSPISQEETA